MKNLFLKILSLRKLFVRNLHVLFMKSLFVRNLHVLFMKSLFVRNLHVLFMKNLFARSPRSFRKNQKILLFSLTLAVTVLNSAPTWATSKQNTDNQNTDSQNSEAQINPETHILIVYPGAVDEEPLKVQKKLPYPFRSVNLDLINKESLE